MPDTTVNTNTFPNIVCCTESIYPSTTYLPNKVECLLYIKHCPGIPGKHNGQSIASLSSRISQLRDSYMNHPAMINCDHTVTQAPGLPFPLTTQKRGHFLPKGFLSDIEKEILPLPVVGEKGESWPCLGAACSSLGSLGNTQPPSNPRHPAASLSTPQTQHREGLRFTEECPVYLSLQGPTIWINQGEVFPGPKRQGVML